MPNRFTRGKALVGALSVDANVTALNNVTVAGDLSVTGTPTFASQGSVTSPTGGATIDTQARSAIGTIINILQAVGLSD